MKPDEPPAEERHANVVERLEQRGKSNRREHDGGEWDTRRAGRPRRNRQAVVQLEHVRDRPASRKRPPARSRRCASATKSSGNRTCSSSSPVNTASKHTLGNGMLSSTSATMVSNPSLATAESASRSTSIPTTSLPSTKCRATAPLRQLETRGSAFPGRAKGLLEEGNPLRHEDEKRRDLARFGVVSLVERRGRDLNPRCAVKTHNGFRDRRIRPLCHLSSAATGYRTRIEGGPYVRRLARNAISPRRAGAGGAGEAPTTKE